MSGHPAWDWHPLVTNARRALNHACSYFISELLDLSTAPKGPQFLKVRVGQNTFAHFFSFLEPIFFFFLSEEELESEESLEEDLRRIFSFLDRFRLVLLTGFHTNNKLTLLSTVSAVVPGLLLIPTAPFAA